MAKLLRNLLGSREPMFSLKLRSLEAATGNPKADLSLLSDITAGAGAMIKLLGLDPNDTTPGELHEQLMQKTRIDDAELSRAFGGDMQKLIQKLTSKAPLTAMPVIKDSVLKKILQKIPPKKVMQALGFRSTESLLKRAPLEQLLLGAFLLESINWHRSFARDLKSLSPTDITMEKPRVVLINPKLIKNGRYAQVVALQCAGLVGVPKFANAPGSTILTAALACEGLFHLHVRGILLKLSRFQDSCIRQIAHFSYASPEPVAEIGKISVPWISCYGLISRNLGLQQELPEGAVEASDFFWASPSQLFPMLDLRVNFWDKSAISGLANAVTPVSLNISDIAHDLYNRVPLSNSTLSAMRRGLHAELLTRYLDKSSQKENILKKLGLA